MKNKKRYEIELLRVAAIFLVIFNHTRERGYSLYMEGGNGFTYWGSLSLSILCKIAVPIFFMISGSLLLEKEESLKQLFSKRILRFVIVILLFTFLQYLRIVRVHPENGFRIETWLLYCYTGNIIEPYWFLKSYLSMLLILPFLRRLVSVMQKRDYLFLISVKAVITGIFLIQIYTGYMTNLSFPFHVDIVFYPLMGHFLMNMQEEGQNRVFRGRRLAGALLLVLAGTVLQANAYFKSRGEYVDDFHTLYVWILAALVLLLAKKIKIRTPMVQKLVCEMGSCAFGVYLIEDVVRNQVERIMPAITPFLGGFAGGIVFTFLSFLMAMLIIYCVKKIPLVRRLI